MNCQQIDEYLFEYCSNNLSPESRAEFIDHLQTCEHCQAVVNETLLEDDILRESADLPRLNDDFTLRVMQQISTAASYAMNASEASIIAPASKRSPRFYLGGAAAAAVILLALFVPGILQLTSLKHSVEIADTAAPQQSQSTLQKSDSVLNGSAKKSEITVLPDLAENSSSGNSEVVPPPTDLDTTKPLAATGSISSDGGQYMYPAISSLSIPTASVAGGQDKQPSRTSTAAQESSLLALRAMDSYDKESLANQDLMRLQPDNLPASCRLEKIIHTNPMEITYQYGIADTQQTLSITISPIAFGRDESDTADSMPIKIQEIFYDSPDESSQTDVAQTNDMHIMREFNDTMYLVDLSSNLPVNDLNYIANTIKFKEDVDLDPSIE